MPLITKEVLSQYRRGQDVGSEMLSQDQEVFIEAFNIIYARLESIRTMVIDQDSDIVDYPILTEILKLKNDASTLASSVTSLGSDLSTSMASLQGGLLDIETRVNNLDANKASKADLNLLLSDVQDIKGYADQVMADYYAGNFTGEKGDKGDTAISVAIGSTTTVDPEVPASVTNVGTDTEAILNFDIPRGSVGSEGPQGATGPEGPQGPQGPQGPMGILGEITFAVPGELAVGNGLSRWYITQNLSITNVIISASTAPTGASIIADVNKNGTTLFTTPGNRPAIPAGDFYSFVNVPDVTTLVAGDYLTIDIDQVGSTIPGAELIIRVQVDV